MSQVWFKGSVCGQDNCPSSLYRKSDGQLICQFGHVQDTIETNDDADDNFVMTKRLGLSVNEESGAIEIRQPKRKQRVSKSKRLMGNQGRELYLKSLQIILQKQIQSFILIFFPDDARFEKELNFVVKLYWTRLLESFLKKNSTHFDEDERNQVIRFALKPGTRLPTVLDTLLIIYLATYKLNYYPVYIHEVIAMAKANKIPFVKTTHLLPQFNIERVPSIYIDSLDCPFPQGERLFLTLTKTIKRISFVDSGKHINYFYPMAFKVLSETLLLPNSFELFVLLSSLVSKLDHTFTHSSVVSKFNPDIVVVGFIIFCIKLHFIYINDNLAYQEWLNILHKSDTKTISMSDFASKNHFESIFNLAEWSDEKIDSYCDYINDVFVSSQTSKQSVMYERLFQIFNLDAIPARPPIDGHVTVLDYMGQYARPKESKIGKKDIHIIETALFNKFASIYGTTPQFILSHYQFAEQLVKDYIARK